MGTHPILQNRAQRKQLVDLLVDEVKMDVPPESEIA